MINTNARLTALPRTSRSFDLRITTSIILKCMNHTDPKGMYIKHLLQNRLRSYSSYLDLRKVFYDYYKTNS
jgi:hypothetical protein